MNPPFDRVAPVVETASSFHNLLDAVLLAGQLVR